MKSIKPTAAENAIMEAERYSHFAVEHLSLTNRKRERELENALESYKINFLFPNLNEIQRAVVGTMYQVCRRVTFELASGSTIGKSTKATRHFAQLKAVADRLVFPKLTPMQQEIASMEFMP